MKENLFTIGEVAKIKGITIRALRFYDRIGLLKPYHIDPDNRYRYYHISQFVYLDIIKAARMMDISPNDLIPYFKEKNSKGLVSFLDRHKEKIRRRMNDLEDILDGIDEVKKSLHNAETAGKEDEVYIRHLPDRFAVTIPFVQRESMEDIVLNYSELYLAVSRSGWINTYEEGLLFTKNDKDEFSPGYLCNFVAGVKGDPDCCLIPEGTYVCVCYPKEKAEQQQKKLWDYLQKQNLTPLDLVQVGLLTDLLAEETNLLELQARV
jgi:MerR family transcriptional regulator, activator of bmr gene